MFLRNIFSYSHILNKSVLCSSIFSPNWVKSFARPIHLSYPLKEEAGENSTSTENIRDASKDRSQVIPVETSIRYLKSKAYAETYGSQPVWKLYRRNHKGLFPPRKTRKTCIRSGKIATGNPCPICRDEYLVLKPENTELLEQFISPFTGETLSYSVTGICQKKHKQLLISVEVAKDKGLIKFDVPFRTYDYSWYKS